MRLLAPLLRSILAITVVAKAPGAYVGLTVFPLSEPQLRAFVLSLAIAAPLECVAISAAVLALVKPLSRALAGAVGDAEVRLAAAAARATRGDGAVDGLRHDRCDRARARTVRGKILVLGFGLDTIGVLLLAPAGYVHHRADVDRESPRGGDARPGARAR